MLNINKGRIDPDKVTNGVYWSLVIEADGTFSAKPVSRPPSSVGWLLTVPPGVAYDRALEDARRPYLDKVRSGTQTDDEEAVIIGTALAKGVLRGWGNLTVGTEPLPYSQEKAVEILTSRTWDNFRQLLIAIARDRKGLLLDEEEKAAGNSQSDSAGA